MQRLLRTAPSIGANASGVKLNLETLDRDVRKRIVPVFGEGVWYSTGRVFYADTDEADEVEDLSERQAPDSAAAPDAYRCVTVRQVVSSSRRGRRR